MNQGPILSVLFLHMSPWDRTQNAPLVCRKWAAVARTLPPIDPAKKRMAWLVWKHLLEDRGEFGSLLRCALPSPCMLRGYPKLVTKIFHRFISTRTGLFSCPYEVLKRVMPFLYSETPMDHETDLAEWVHFHRKMMTSEMTTHRLGGHVNDDVAILQTLRLLFTLVDDGFWSEFSSKPCDSTNDPMRPLHECYLRLSDALNRNFGITDIAYGECVKHELEVGPSRALARVKKRARRNPS